MTGHPHKMLQQSLRAGTTEHPCQTTWPRTCRQRRGYDTPSFLTLASKELNMTQALHVEPKVPVQPKTAMLELLLTNCLQIFGKMQLFHCRPKYSPVALASR